MEVQEQRQREEESQREAGTRAMGAIENKPLAPVGTEGRNVLTLTDTGGSSIINVSLTSSLQPDIRPRIRPPSQEVTARPPQQSDEGRRSTTPNLVPIRSDNSIPIMQLQRERARHHYEPHGLDQRVGERLYGTGTDHTCPTWMM